MERELAIITVLVYLWMGSVKPIFEVAKQCCLLYLSYSLVLLEFLPVKKGMHTAEIVVNLVNER